MINAKYNGIEFEVSFKFNPYIVNDIKNIEGRSWDKANTVWRIPREQHEALNQIIMKHGGNALDTSQLPSLAPLEPLPELDIELNLKRPMFPYQATGTAQMIKLQRCINGDEPGLGKTTQAIAATIGLNGFPMLVVCPSTLKENWQREIFTVAGMPAMILSDKVKNSWHQYWHVGKVKIFITNYESLKKYFVDSIDVPKPDPENPEKKKSMTLKHVHFKKTVSLFKTIIIDEIHRCKSSQTQQSKFIKGICDGVPNVFGLTGTPVVNSPRDLMSQLSIINRLVDLGGYKHFERRYCGKDGKSSSNLGELNYMLNKTCFFQRQKKDVLPDLPPKVRQIVYCDITTREEYNKAMDDLREYLRRYKERTEDEIEKSMRGEVMVRIGICKNISARGKLNEVFEGIDQVVEAGHKIGVFIHQREIGLAILNRYPGSVSVRGDDSNEQRQKNVDAFQNNPNVQVIVCSIKAAGVGITLTAASRMCFVELPWHAADSNQCEDRFHRIGQLDSVHCVSFLGQDTIDEWIYELIESKRDTANQITGVEESAQKEIIDKIYTKMFNPQPKIEEHGQTY